MRRRGIFITFEGIDGCGKSTQAKLLYDYLSKAGHRCILTREPGGSRLGEDIRQILLNPRHGGMSAVSETLLFEASRVALVKNVIIPRLEEGYIVISDRFSDATLAYQGYAGGEGINILKKMNRYASFNLKPDLTILLDVDAKTGLKRSKAGYKAGVIDRMEKKSLAYHKRVRSGYLKLAELNKKRIRVIKTRATPERTQDLIRKIVDGIL